MAYFPRNEQKAFTPMPASIAKAIASVKATVDAVKKSAYNKHGGFHYATVDDIYAAVAIKEGEVGLVIIPLQVDLVIERTQAAEKTVQWLKVTYQFILSCGGDSWTHEGLRRTVLQQYLGPQTHEATESYANKAFSRSLYKLPTGDLDLASMPEAETMEDQAAMLQPRKRKSSAAAKKDGGTELFNEIMGHLKGSTTKEGVQFIREKYATEWAEMPTRWHEMLEDEYDLQMSKYDAFALSE